MQKKKSIFVKCTFLLCLSFIEFGALQAQSGFTQHSGARSIGLANIVSLISDASAAIGNPAILPYHNIQGVQATAAQRLNLSSLKELQLSGAISVGKKASAFLSIQSFGFSDYTEQKFAVGYAMKVSKNAAVSVQLNGYQVRIDEFGSTFKPGFEIGLYTEPFKEFGFSATIANPVRTSVTEGIRIPTIIRIGSKYTPSEKVNALVEVEKDIDFPVSLKAAIEYFPVESFALRIGAKTNPSTIHMGLGYQIESDFGIDIGIGYHTLLGITPGIGLSFHPNKN